MKKAILILVFTVIMSTITQASYAEELTPNVKSSILMEASTGEVLYENNPDEHLPIASVTKIMTMLLIMERIDSGALKFDDMVTVSENANSYGGSTMFLETGEQLSVHDMMKGIAVASANDGCVAMAEHIAGSEAGFVELMNKRAAELGMNNTVFLNTNGLDADGQYSSARDVAIMSRELIKHEKVFEYTKIWTDSLRDGKFALANTNKLIRFYNGATGLKTGSTSKAGCCLSATAERDGMGLIAVVLGAADTKTRFSSASALLNYGFSGYTVKKQIEKGEPTGVINVSKGIQKEIKTVANSDYSVLMSRAQPIEIEKSVKLEDFVIAPVKKGDKVGEINFTQDGKITQTVDIVADEDVEKKGFCLVLMDVLYEFICG
ncbi:MAG: D-alanyl-D-alanine carboxypeptidase [Clostridia bacterium]|nr:D-alanyl-D-alanine carboxypeptidase [Clostridia bacterium]